jgi:magnesium chelatase family protein
MSLSVVHSRALLGLQARPVLVEVHLANGLPNFTLVGLADTEVKEARERVRSAIVNSGLDFPLNKRITVNLAPADLPKDSGRFDLPIALGILAAAGQLDAARLEAFEFAGELSLGGQLRPVRGALAMALAAAGARALVLPKASAQEAACVSEARVYAAGDLAEVVRQFLPGEPASDEPWARVSPAERPPAPPQPDMAEVKGQVAARRAVEVAAAGGHSLLLMGPPGSGKSMLAQRLAGLLPPMDLQEALESAAIASLAGRFAPERWALRPTCAPHHTASAVALVGGGSPPRPGEISLAHGGVLFLDELPEFPRAALEALREPLETGRIHIARAAQRSEFPARFQLVAAMNPCPCGHLGSSVRACRCSGEQVARYQGKISGPLLDRIDLQVEVAALPPDELVQVGRGEPSAVIAARVQLARQLAQERQDCSNAALSGQALDEHCALHEGARPLLTQAATRLGWSGRSIHRCLKVARTIADLAGSAQIQAPHLAEAIQYRRGLKAG